MRRVHSIHALFAGLLSACGPGIKDKGTSSSGDGCGDYTEVYSEHVQVPLSQVIESQDEDGMIRSVACPTLCEDVDTWGSIISCELSEVSSGSTGADPGTTGDAPGTTGDAPGTTGIDPETTTDGSSGSEGGGESGFEYDPLVTVRCEIEEGSYCIGGRGHEALRSHPAPRGGDALGRWLATMAHSEAASVVAFLGLADELAAHGAPAALVQRARAAATDEVAHAEAMARLARRRGAEVPTPRFDPLEVRDLVRIAVENAVEGCVRETWAALEASVQARTAADPELRAVMVQIAADETRHAQLSHDLDRWIRTRLDDEATARVDAARRRAVEQLRRGLATEHDAPLRRQAGLPEPAVAQALCEGLEQQLWS